MNCTNVFIKNARRHFREIGRFVELGGLEPPSKQAAKMLSTRLAFVEFSFVFLVKSEPKHNLFSVIQMFYRNL